MSVGVTYAGIPLSNPTPLKMPIGVISNATMLLSGLVNIQTISASIFKVRFTCILNGQTLGLTPGQVPAEITNVTSLIGSLNLLVINGQQYSNCAISNFEYDEADGSGGMIWTYDVEFTQHTAV